MAKHVVTPWKVEGEVDYYKIIREFGVEEVNEKLLQRIKKHTGKLHHMLRRKIFFSHIDMNYILDEYEKGNKFFLYTGRGPSGNTHLGHLVPWMFTKWLQDKFDVDLWFQMTDDEKFLFNPDLELEDTNKLAYENAAPLSISYKGFHSTSKTGYLNPFFCFSAIPNRCPTAQPTTMSLLPCVIS